MENTKKQTDIKYFDKTEYQIAKHELVAYPFIPEKMT